MKKIYLACPYSHPDSLVREDRVQRVDKKAAELMKEGYRVFSPISHSHGISFHCGEDYNDLDFRMNQDLWILDMCDELWIFCIEGWNKSKGVGVEINRAVSSGKRAVFTYEDNT